MDIVEVLTDSPTPRQYWGKVKDREFIALELSPIWVQLNIEEIENPELAQDRVKEYYELKGYPTNWIDKRVRGIAIRQDLTDEWKFRGVQKEKDFAFFGETISIAKASGCGAD